jgi:hypothetical protein
MKYAPPPMLVKRLSSLNMVNPVAFIVLLAYICSALLLLPRGEKRGSHAHSLHQIWPSIAKRAVSWLPCRVGTHNTTHLHTTHLPPLLSRRSPGNTSVSSPLPPLSSPCLQHLLLRWMAAARCSRATASEKESSFTMLSSVYTTNVGPGTFTITLQPEPSIIGSGNALARVPLGRRPGQCLMAMGPSTTNLDALEIFLGTIATLGINFGTIRSLSGVVFDHGCKARSYETLSVLGKVHHHLPLTSDNDDFS